MDIFLIFLDSRLLNVYPLKTDKRLEFYFRVYEFIKLEWLQVELDVLKHPLYAKAVMCKAFKRFLLLIQYLKMS